MCSKLCITCLLLMGVLMAQGQNREDQQQTISEIIQTNKAKLKSTKQLLLVYNEKQQDAKAVLIALEKRHRKWEVKLGPVDAGMGRNGFALPGGKCEGDGKSPSGVFRLGQLFCYDSLVNTHLPFIHTTRDDKWIDDPQSDDYNHYVRGNTSAKSFEKLLIRSDAYKYCMVIEYNTHPVVKGKGSAIFFHLGLEPTSGCISITEENMNRILEWMKGNDKPSILMGNVDALRNGL